MSEALLNQRQRRDQSPVLFDGNHADRLASGECFAPQRDAFGSQSRRDHIAPPQQIVPRLTRIEQLGDRVKTPETEIRHE